MKKKIIIIATISIFAIIASFMINFTVSSVDKSFSLANSEALARGEGSSTISNGPGEERYCASCMTYHTYCKARKTTRCVHTGH